MVDSVSHERMRTGDLENFYMFSCSCDAASSRELRLAAKYKLREMEVGRSPETAESTRPVKDVALASTMYSMNTTLRLSRWRHMGEILAEVLRVHGTYATAVPKCQSYATFTDLPRSLFATLLSDTMLTILQQDTHQEYYQH